MLEKQNKVGATVLRDFLRECNEHVDFESFTKDQLADTLQRFYMSARTRKGEYYRSKSLSTIRYAINRFLQAPPNNRDFDIINDPEFKKANDAFRLAMTEVKI